MKETKNNTTSVEAQKITITQLVTAITRGHYNEYDGCIESACPAIINLVTEPEDNPMVIGTNWEEKEGKVNISIYYWDSENEDEDPYEYGSFLVEVKDATRFANALHNLPAKWGIQAVDGFGGSRNGNGEKATDDETGDLAVKLVKVLKAMETIRKVNEERTKAEAALRKAKDEANNAANKAENEIEYQNKRIDDLLK